MKYLKIGAFALTTSLLVISSCNKDDTSITESVDPNQVSQIEYGLPKDVLDKVRALKINPGDIEFEAYTYPDGVTSELVILSGDIALKKEEFLKLSNDPSAAKQYQAENVIDTARFQTVDIYALIGDSIQGLSPLAQQGVRDAVQNWNASGANLDFTVTFGTDRNFDRSVYEIFIAVNSNPNPGFGGRAEFPSGGNPGTSLTITSGANNSRNRNAANAMKYLMTHEIGHAIGFRHTDWDTRRSCVRVGVAAADSREPDAIHIAGTPLSNVIQVNSIMNACFSVDETTGNLNANDMLAAQVLYPPIVDPR